MIARPILFSGPMVRAILEGRKTVTRRLVKTRYPVSFLGGEGEFDDPSCWGWWFDGPDHNGYMVLGRGLNEQENHGSISIPSPYGEAGDRLWVKETFAAHVDHPDALTLAEYEGGHNPERLLYRADEGRKLVEHYGIPWERLKWKPSIFMPRWASRITLEVVSVRVERLHAIDEEDAKREGARPFFETFACFGRDQTITSGERAADAEHRAGFAVLWDEINGDRANWKSNPWVWRVEFKRTS